MKSNLEFKAEALGALRGHWGQAVITVLIYAFIVMSMSGPMVYNSYHLQEQITSMAGSSSSIYQTASLFSSPEFLEVQQKASRTNGITSILEILLMLPLSLGIANAFKMLLFWGDGNILYNAFRISFRPYWRNVWGMLLSRILIFLWSLLFVIPGIVKAFSYAMTPYILQDNPELSASEAIHRSRMMMRGHKFDLFWLYLGFIGWFFLCILTAGIGFLWLAPYVETSKAAFYREVKADYAVNGGLD